MKLLVVFCFLLFTFQINAQERICGEYRDYFGENIDLHCDSTFRYDWQFDVVSSWTKGIWRINNDTIAFTTVLIFDTLRYKNENGVIIDSLVLSSDDTSSVVTKEFLTHEASLSISWGQNRKPICDKIYYKKDRLYSFNKKGKLITRKCINSWTGEYYRPWFIKIDRSKSTN